MEATNDVNGVTVVGERERFNEAVTPRMEVERVPVPGSDVICDGCAKPFANHFALGSHLASATKCPLAIEKRAERKSKKKEASNSDNDKVDVGTVNNELAKSLALREAVKARQDALANAPEKLEEWIEDDYEREKSIRAYVSLLMQNVPTADLVMNHLPLLSESVFEKLDVEDLEGFADLFAPLANKNSVDDAMRKKSDQAFDKFCQVWERAKRQPKTQVEIEELHRRIMVLSSRDYVADVVLADISESELLVCIRNKCDELKDVENLALRNLIGLGAYYRAFQALYKSYKDGCKKAGKKCESEIQWRKTKLGMESDNFAENVFPAAGLCYLLSLDFPMFQYAAVGKTLLVKGRNLLRKYFTAKTDEGARRRRMWFPDVLSVEEQLAYDEVERRYMAGDVDSFVLGEKNESRKAPSVECESSNSDEDEIGPGAGGVSSNRIIDPVDGVGVGVSNIDAKFRNEKSWKGHPLDELKSGLQKGIRRCDIKLAYYCAIELLLFSEVKDGDRIVSNLVNRIRTIALEDVGISGPGVVFCVDKLLCDFESNRAGKNTPSQLQLILEAVTLLCNARHLRGLDHYRAMFVEPEFDAKLKRLNLYVPFVAVDHGAEDERFPVALAEGELLLGDHGSLRYICSQVVELLNQQNPVALRLISWIVHEATTDMSNRKSPGGGMVSDPVLLVFDLLEYGVVHLGWAGDTGILLRILERMKDCYWPRRLAKEAWMFYIFPALLILRRDSIDFTMPQRLPIDGDAIYKEHMAQQVPYNFPPYVIDDHTARGRSLGRGAAEFIAEGSYVANEDQTLLVPKFKRAYEEMLRWEENDKGDEAEAQEPVQKKRAVKKKKKAVKRSRNGDQ